MADMLVDSIKLDACLNAEADAIRAKTGDSNDIPFDYANNKGFADAIAAISGGGGVEITKRTYTHTEDWLAETDSYQKFITAYIQNTTTAISLAVINNTSTENLAAQSAVYDNVLTLIKVCRRKTSIGSAVANTFKIGSGSTIIIYEIQRSAFQ